MWEHPTNAGLGKRDAIGAWLMCLAIAARVFQLTGRGGPRQPGCVRGIDQPRPDRYGGDRPRPSPGEMLKCPTTPADP